MVAFSAIEWCDHTINPWIGCQKAGPGCDNCYAEARDIRFDDGKHWGPGAPRRRTSAANWAQLRKWNAGAAAFRAEHGHPPRVFALSLGDILDNAVDQGWRRDFWIEVRETRNLRYILVTKRIGNAPAMLPEGWLDGDFDHVGILSTIVNQAEADRDLPKLLDLPMTDQQWRGVSYEPALGPVDFTRIRVKNRHGFEGAYDALRGDWRPDGETATVMHPRATRLNWIICGGESGPNARPLHPGIPISIRDQCAAAGTAFLFKQWGSWLPGYYSDSRHTALLDEADGPDQGITLGAPPHDAGHVHDWGDGRISINVGKKKAGRMLLGQIHHAFPRALL